MGAKSHAVRTAEAPSSQSITLETLLNLQKFAQNFLYIEAENPLGGKSLTKLSFNKAQKYYIDNKKPRNIIVKARQIGMSTGILAKNFHKLITQPMTMEAMVTHKDEISTYMAAMVTRFRYNLPFHIVTGADSSEHIEIVFDDPNTGQRRTSNLYLGTAGARVWGRAQSFNVVHLTELAHWVPEKIQEILAGILNAVSQNAEVDIESTPRGRSGYFYELYDAAKRGEVPYKPFFFPWWWCERYRMPVDHPLVVEEDKQPTLTSEEKALVNHHGLDLDQIRWRRWKWREQDRIQKDLFRQEYPENDVDCWLVAGLAAFDQRAISEQLQTIIQPIEVDNFLTVWKKPIPMRNYIIGVDTGEGLPFGDYSVGCVIDLQTGENVATLRARLPSDVFTEMLIKLAIRYNRAYIVVERPKGEAVLLLLSKANYTNLHVHRDAYDKSAKVGFPMSKQGRNNVLDSFGNALRVREFVTSDTVLLNECLDFQFIDGKRQAPPGKYDDSIFAAALAWYCREYAPQFNQVEHVSSERYI